MPWRGKIQLFFFVELHPGAFINFIDCAGVNIIKVRIKKKAGISPHDYLLSLESGKRSQAELLP